MLVNIISCHLSTFSVFLARVCFAFCSNIGLSCLSSHASTPRSSRWFGRCPGAGCEGGPTSEACPLKVCRRCARLELPPCLREPGTSANTEILKQDWTVVLNPGVSDEQVAALCKLSDCKAVGHPSSGGVPFFEVSCTESELESLMKQASNQIPKSTQYPRTRPRLRRPHGV